MCRFIWTRRRFVAGLCLLSISAAGCMTDEEWRRFWRRDRDKGSQPQPMPEAATRTVALRDAIGPLVTVDGLRLTQVRGYGLVVDLVDTGGADGPEIVKNYLIKEMRRRQQPSDAGTPSKEVLESKDTAMVEATGLMPAGAKEGDRFDVVIRALGTQTKSLVGGKLFLCDLKLYADSPSGVIEGKALAAASGPVFVSPFNRDGDPATNVDLRTGFVLGGGIVKDERRVRLVLNDPSYSVAQRIVARLNGRYAADEPVAVGQSPSYIDLKVPNKYGSRKRLFLEHVIHTTLNSNESFLKQRARDLADEITQPQAECESIGLAWEAIGPLGLPTIRDLYVHPDPKVSYYAGRSGLRLSDRGGMEVVARHAKDPDSPFHNEAIDELGYAVDLYGAGECLRKLLDEDESGVRIRAYKALRHRVHPAIQSQVLYDDNLILDVVDSQGPHLIYVQRSLAPRIAVFGKQMRCQPPAIYPGERRDGRRIQSQITAKEGDDALTIMFFNKRGGRWSPPMSLPPSGADLIKFLGGTPVPTENGRVEGLGAAYSEIVDILSWFCESKTIPAKFIVEDLTGTESYDEAGRRERRESEL